MNTMNSLRKIRDRVNDLKDIGKNPYRRILMEKEKQNVTYDYLVENLDDKNMSVELLKKNLTKGKFFDPALVEQLYKILGIHSEFDNNEAVAIYHYTKTRPSNVGRPSNSDKANRQILYNKAQQRKSNHDKGEYSIDELLLNFADNSDEAEHYELECFAKEIDFLKRALLIYREFPQAFDDLFSTITFDEQDEEKLKRLEIEIHEH